MTKILEVNNLYKKYPGFSLNNVSFGLEKGYIMGFIGANGAGKTTTIKAIMNLIKKDAGEIKVFGLDNIKHEREIKDRIGFVYDEIHFFEELTILETKKILSPFYTKWDDKAFYKYIDIFNLPLKKKIKQLSKGMKMKFSLALALSHNAELIIMDEPTSGLDPVFRSEFLDILRDFIQDENKGIIFSTHITSDLENLADYICLINNGDIVLCDEQDIMYEKYALIKGGKELLNSDTRKELIGIKENKHGFEALTTDKVRASQIFGDKVLIEKASLDDIMLHTVRGAR